MEPPKVFSENEVREILTWERLVPEIKNALISFSDGAFSQRNPDGVVQPLRSRIDISDKNGLLLLMPGYIPSKGALATKIVTVFPSNAERNLPSISATVLLLCPDTGRHLAFVDGNSVTELRTAAASIVATQALGRNEINIVAILGAGAQGRAHARAHNQMFGPQEIRIWSRNEARCKELVELLCSEGVPAIGVSTVEAAVLNADVVNTCTLASKPILFSSMIEKGVHINAVGAASPDEQEIEAKLMTSSLVVTDSLEAALSEAGDVILSGAKIYGELGNILKKGITSALKTETTIFKSLGLAVLDATAAKLVYDKE